MQLLLHGGYLFTANLTYGSPDDQTVTSLDTRVVADLESVPTQMEAIDVVLVQTPSSWDGENWRLLGLAGLTLWQWSGYGSPSGGEA